MLIPALAIVASGSSLVLLRDIYHHLNYFSSNSKKQKTDSDENDDMHSISSTTSRRSASPSSAAQRLSLLEEKGIQVARLRSIRILALIGLIIICVLIMTDASSAASSLYKAFQDTPSITTASGIATLCQKAIKASASNTFGTISLLFSLYLLLQTFCIPGTIALNAVLGALLGTAPATVACVVLGTVGASCCYTLSSAIGTSLANWLDTKLMKGKGIHELRTQVNKYRSDLLSYLLFLRLTPVLPNWLINLASPILGIPLKTFALATFLGITPQTYLSVRFGAAAKTLSESMVAAAEGGDGEHQQQKIVTIYDTLLIAMIGIMVIVVNKLKSRFGGGSDNGKADK